MERLKVDVIHESIEQQLKAHGFVEDNEVTKRARAVARNAATVPMLEVHYLYEELDRAHELLKAAVPLLVRLGDFIANKEGRCEVILKIRELLNRE